MARKEDNSNMVSEHKLSVPGMIKRYAEKTPEKIAVIVGEQCVSYAELYAKINSAVAYFQKLGMKTGSHVLTVAKPDLAYLVCMYALLGIGAVHIPAENKVPAARLVEIADAVDADLVISPEKPDCDCRWISPEDVKLDSPVCDWEPVGVSMECSEIIFTTGTTGKSKGVMLSSHCLDTYLAAMNPSFCLTEESVFLLTTPLNHVGGLHRTHQCMAAGCTIILMDGVRDLRGFFGAIHTYGVTHTYLPPASVKLLITLAKKEVAKLNGKLKFVYTASAPFPVADIEKLMELLPDTHLHQGYGSSETGSICNCCYNAPGETINCLGKPYDCVEVKLFDADGNAVTEPNVPGFICSKSDMNMLGYYKEPELTASVLKDGFVYSKDLMYFDEKGGLHFAGRGDDVININGFKVAPTEVENCVLKCPSVNECLCIPYEDRVQGRVMKLLVCLNEGYTLDTDALSAYLAKELEAYKVPKYIEEVDQIMKIGNGKIDRKKMISMYSNG